VGSAGACDTVVASSSGRTYQHDPPCFLIVYNITKRHNIGNIARSASAFGVAQVGDYPHPASD
jgi:tRNA G18 (ribose-2'-O)-methylase SpoU